MTNLEHRAQRLQSIQDIIALKHRYWHYNDTGLLGDEIAPLFTKDGVWSNAELGHYEGREAIRTFFDAAFDALPFCAHIGINPIIEIDGSSAVARRRALLPGTFADDAERKSHMILIDYLDDFKHIDGRWYISKLDILFNFNVEFGTPWEGTERVRDPG